MDRMTEQYSEMRAIVTKDLVKVLSDTANIYQRIKERES